ncbi:MAG TPA: LytR C-terminal domain-containing protein [Thermoleophilaceae bacterium]|nr:LytR C-terminal domain-containing protein [Thermoleophilaceae bacterium]
MEIIEQIGSYAGLAAVLGLAVLSALYFSQARDVRRLREWAGRGPERTGEPATAPAQRVVAQPVPQAPGQVTQPGAKPATAAGAKPAAAAAAGGGAAAGAAAASAAGAAPATASGPAAPATAAGQGAATAAGARAVEKEGVSQDTVVHPPPTAPGDAGDGAKDEDREDDATGDRDGIAPGVVAVGGAAPGAAGAAAAPHGDEDEADDADEDDEHFGDADEDDLDDDDEDAGEDDEDFAADADADDDDEDTGDRPAVAAPNLPPSRPLTAAGARRPVPPPALPPRAAAPGRGNATGSILPPYARSRPGGPPEPSSPEPSGRRTAIMAIAGGLLLLVGVGFGATQLLGEDEGGAQPAGQASQQQSGGSGGGDAGQGAANRRRAAVDPGSVTVAVLNGTTVPGLAAQIGDNIEGQGFQLGTITNSTDQQRAESVVLYAPGAENEARDVARRLNISQREEADPDSQGLAGDATVIVVAGQDQTR